MRKLTYLLIIQSIFILNVFASEDKAADFTLKDLSGKEFSLSDYKGKVILVNFWATWCGPCLKEMPDLEKLYQKYKSKNFQILGIAVASKEKDIPKKVQSTGVTYPVLLGNNQTVSDYGGFSSIPQSFIIDRDGSIVMQITGSWSYEQFEKVVMDLLE
ncbi:MAG: TlpA family protein disulfide reductase [Calditrichaceae bacterium]